ncbi:DoxX family protein [Nonomuraea wenchangensis]|uniref:DoxX family protein n=1 Tax=Nonomuraea wenchangensis TaxID=568860 RepID=UPI00371CE4FD
MRPTRRPPTDRAAGTGIAPILVPLAATGLATIMVGAVILRIRRHEAKAMLLDLFYLVPIVFVAIGRFGPESFII